MTEVTNDKLTHSLDLLGQANNSMIESINSFMKDYYEAINDASLQFKDNTQIGESEAFTTDYSIDGLLYDPEGNTTYVHFGYDEWGQEETTLDDLTANELFDIVNALLTDKYEQ